MPFLSGASARLPRRGAAALAGAALCLLSVAAFAPRAVAGKAQPTPGKPQGGKSGAGQKAEDEAFAPVLGESGKPGLAQDFPIRAPATVAVPALRDPAPPGAWFVSPDAKAGSAGTSADAPTTIDRALRDAPEGATIVLRGGVYRTGGLRVPRRLTLRAYPGEQPWLKGSVVVTGWRKDGDLWRRDGWTAEFKPEGRLDRIVDPAYPMAIYGDQAFLSGKALFQVGSRGQVKPGRFYVDHQNDALYIGDDPQNKTVEATVHGSGLDVVKRADVDATGSAVRGVGFTHYARQGMIVAAPRVVIENCAFAWNGNRGLYFNPGSGEALADCVVRGSSLIANGQAGVSAGRASRLLFEKNLVSHNNVEGFRQQWGAAGIKFFGFDGLVCRDNVVERNNAHGIWLDVNADAATVVRNVSRFNVSGVFFEVSDRAIIAFNTCRRNNVGILLSNSHNARVYNNTLVENGNNIRVNQGARVNTGHEGGTPDNTIVANTAPGATFTTRGHVIRNNILWNSRPDAQGPLFFTFVSPKQPQGQRLSSLMVTALDHNAFHRTNPAQPPRLASWSPTGEKTESYDTLAAFVSSAAGQGSLETTGADPYFVDATKGDFRLRPGSPALNKAAPLPADIAGAAGVPPAVGYLGALPPG